LALGGHGLRVGIIEKSTLPHYKTCGAGVLRRAIALLPVDVRAAVERECHAVELRIARWLTWVLYDCPRLRVRLFRRHGQRMSELMRRIVSGETTYRAAITQPGNYLKLFRRAA
jgi:hypothetical protein